MSAEFLVTVGAASQLEKVIHGDFLKGRREPRIAFVGRSNVGKSSLLNALLGTKLAQVSKEPGKTRNIHFYVWPEAGWVVADLPGYGFAKASHTERDRWAKFIEAYLKEDPGLVRVLLLLDSRHGPTPLDIQAMNFLRSQGVELVFVFTKTDQLKNQSMRALRRKEVKEALAKLGYDESEAFWVSAQSKDGLKKLSQALNRRS